MVNRSQIEKEIEAKRKDIDNSFDELNRIIRINVHQKTKTVKKTASVLGIVSLIATAIIAVKFLLLKSK